jgi:1,4-alpha-glucan branching enzyme
MLYLDYGRESGKWRPNKNGGRENLDAAEFIKELSITIFHDFPDIIMAAEESTSWPMVTKPVYMGGLGFNYKWNMGWMNDILHYTALDPIFRQDHHKDLTFSLMYAFSENFILPISHDEVVHGKRSLIGRMPGEYDAKFAGVRAFLTYMYAHPGKKLLFMGQEFGQFIEWNFSKGLDWLLLGYERHRQLLEFVSALNRFYRDNPAMWQVEDSWKGFEWICSDDRNGNTVIFIRRDAAGGELLFAVNFSPVFREGYRIGVPRKGAYTEVFSSDALEFGGGGRLNAGRLPTESVECHGRKQSVRANIPPLGAIVIKHAARSKKTSVKGELSDVAL